MRSAPDFSARFSGLARAPRSRLLALALAACALPGCANGPTATTAQTAQTQAAHALPPDTVTLFPIARYDQNVDHWIDPASSAYDTPFLSPEVQRAQFDALVARYFGDAPNDPSPWNRAFVEQRVYRDGGSDIAALQTRRLALFDNTGKAPRRIGYGMNFRPHTQAWIDAIERNADVNQFEQAGGFDATRRAIATTALLVRELPTLDPSFYSHRIAGEGYPFDNLQVSAVRPGTPLYVLGTSADGAWRYVQTPDVQGWVRSEGVASVDDAFVLAWRAAARQSLGVVVAASAALRDDDGVFRFEAPAGTLLPLRSAHEVLVPARDIEGRAAIRSAPFDSTQIVAAPLAATPRHLAQLVKALIGRPYGWGNTNFDNDCSAELQSIFAAFGVWLPRHSSTQMSAGAMTDLSASTPAARLDWLVQHGAPMRTLIYIGGHVMLYLGTTERDGKTVPLVYQDVWGLRPADNSRRAVIGGSVVLPLLLGYPEDPDLESLAATPVFQVSILGAPAASAPSREDENPAG
ncbi:SH3 domain-containing C40 family peptidase [Paraburkholderia lycopersici]|uniref:NlpC/P60 family protein n=1 Tax=Paraburkholderia lycopersici TaxID=416944 RepID=A0A1G6QD18_9BURK|nr:SH3 domain-containing C40 family peptidase [Paraburkholderia lycopersici]SDC90081.1 NlpC/P60 family protein [Paraburkholderia lycopersici]